MDHIQLLKRAWKILWSYRALWGIGILLALTSGGGGGGNGSASYSSDSSGNFFDLPRDLERGLEDFGDRLNLFRFTPEMLNSAIAIGIGLVCLFLILGILAQIVKYVSQAAAIRMVDRYETSGEKVGFRQGLRLGWSRAALRLFLIDLLLFLPFAAIIAGLIGCGLIVFLTTGEGPDDPSVAGIFAFISVILLMVFVLFIAGLALSLVIELMRRYAVLQERGVIDSIRMGFRLLRRRFLDVFIYWLLLVGLSIAYAIVLIPIVLAVLGVGLLVGGGLAALGYFGSLAVWGEEAAIIAAIVMGLPVFLVIMFIPLLFVEGLRMAYGSIAWTLAFRELTHGEPALAPAPLLDAPAPIIDEPAPVIDEREPDADQPADVVI